MQASGYTIRAAAMNGHDDGARHYRCQSGFPCFHLKAPVAIANQAILQIRRRFNAGDSFHAVVSHYQSRGKHVFWIPACAI